MLEVIYKIIFNRYLVSMVSYLLIGTKLIFAQSGDLHTLKLYNHTSLNSGFVDIFSKSRTPYLHKGIKGSEGIHSSKTNEHH